VTGGPIGTPSTRRRLDPTGLRALRAARDHLVDAASVAHGDAVAASVAAYVRVMLDARFASDTIVFLVHAALDLGTPMPRSPERRARRARTIEEWTVWAATVVDRARPARHE
jgi:hypothetical protein